MLPPTSLCAFLQPQRIKPYPRVLTWMEADRQHGRLGTSLLEYDTRKAKREATWDSDFLHCPATIRIISSFQLKLKQHRLPVTPPPPPPHPFLMGCNSKRSIFKKELFIASSISINEGVFSRARCCCCNHRHWTVTWEIVEICMLAYLCFTSDVL